MNTDTEKTLGKILGHNITSAGIIIFFLIAICNYYSQKIIEAWDGWFTGTTKAEREARTISDRLQKEIGAAVTGIKNTEWYQNTILVIIAIGIGCIVYKLNNSSNNNSN